ncbi:MAG: phosphate ABC transporter substrate-binding protein PstS family protein [Desulfosalsimonadaceae bacterium]|nr:phosphate ABC transporter substrate-binding protein PstS family protein [Desulfosalsimonadaceae bacterium]
MKTIAYLSRRLMISVMISLMAALTMSAPAAAAGITITGSTTVQPIAEKIAEAYMDQHPETRIGISGGGSGNGIKAIIDGATDIGNASRFIKEQELAMACGKGVYPVPFRIAYDCIVPVVHPENPVKDLTIAQLKDIYLGKITNWADVGGTDQPVLVVSRDTSSGTYEVWEDKVMKKEAIFPGANLEASNEAVVKAVASKKGAIGYIGLGYLENSVKSVSVNTIKGSETTTLNGTYPISRPLFMFTKGWPSGELLDFLNYVLDPAKGQKLVKSSGFVALTSAGTSSQMPAGAEIQAGGTDESFETPSTIRTAQLYLNALSYDAGPVDGIKGQKTVSAVMAFQKAAGLSVDGQVSGQLMEVLSDRYRKLKK